MSLRILKHVHAALTGCSLALLLFVVLHVVLVSRDVFSSTPLEECRFCLGANSTEPILLSSEIAIAIQDARPKCTEHYLVLPKAHIKNINSEEATVEVIEALKALCFQIFEQMPDNLDRQMTIHSPPYYSVQHLHLHCLGCSPPSWLSYQMYYQAFHEWQSYRLY